MPTLREGLLVSCAALTLACGGQRTGSALPATDAQPAADAQPEADRAAGGASDAASATMAGLVPWPSLVANKPASDAPAGLAQFGRLVGVWTCTSEKRQQDGTFKAGPGAATWTWFYTLAGKAVQDIWEPSKGAVGTNLRVYNAETDSWDIQWTTGAMSQFEHITAKATDGQIVMHGEVGASNAFPPHRRRITFYDISDSAFEWRYEATKPGGDTNWSEFSRIHCKKSKPTPAL